MLKPMIIFGVVGCSLGSISSQAQNLEDAIESEIDNLKGGQPAAPSSSTATTAPAPVPAPVPAPSAPPPPSASVVVTERLTGASVIRVNTIEQFGGRPPVFREQALSELGSGAVKNRASIEVDELVSRPEMPPLPRSLPVLRNLPPSFVTPVTSEPVAKKYDITGLDAGKVLSLTVPATVVVNSYLLDAEPLRVGKVTEIESGERMASVGEFIYVKLNKDVSVGQRLSVALSKGMIKDQIRGQVGPLMEVSGVIEIVGTVTSGKSDYRALVLTAINPIQPNAYVMEEELPKVSFQRSGTLLSVEARILGGEQGEGRTLFGDSAAVYLDGGAKAGMSVGDMVAVQANRKERREGTVYPNLKKSIGYLKIVKVEPTVATAVVVETREEIKPGDRTGGAMPERLPRLDFDERASSSF